MMNNELRPYADMKNSHQDWLNEVPNHWRIAKAKRIFRETSIKNYPNEELLSATQTRGVIPRRLLETRVVMPMGNFESFKLVKEGNFVISLRSFQGGLEYSKYQGIVSPAYNVLEEFTGQNRMYFKHLMKSQVFISELQRNVTGIRQGKNIDVNDFREIIIPIPPRPEQDQIVKYLDHQLAKINKFIKAKKKLIAVLKEQKQAIINEVVTKGIDPNVKMRPSGIEWLGDVPEHWDIAKLKKYAKINPSMNDLKSKYTSEDNVVFLSMDKISVDGNIDNSELRLIKDVRTGFTAFTKQDVVIAKITPCFENGKGAYLENLDTELGYGTTELIVIRPDQTRLLGKYLYYVTRCEYFRIFGSEVMTGSAGQKRVPSSFVVNFSIGFPGINEQKAIISAIEKQHELINNSIKILNKEVELMMEYKNSLISNVVTGKVDVRNIIFDESEEEVIEDTELEEESIDGEIIEAEDGDE